MQCGPSQSREDQDLAIETGFRHQEVEWLPLLEFEPKCDLQNTRVASRGSDSAKGRDIGQV